MTEFLWKNGEYGILTEMDNFQKIQTAGAVLRKWFDLSENERRGIIDRMLAAWNDKAGKDAARRDLARECGISEGTIGSIMAHHTMRSRKAEGIVSGVGNTVEIILERKVSNVSQKDESVESPIDEDFVRELAREYDLSNPNDRTAFLSYAYDCFDDLSYEDVRKIVPELGAEAVKDSDAHARVGEGMGALIDYDNAVKNRWRRKLKEFIDENTDPEKRKDMKVLCLPGMGCLEIPLYLELGFHPENIVGVEAGIVSGKRHQGVIDRFLENAARYGIQTRIGKLEKIVETEQTAFNVVSLDFLGPFNRSNLDLFRCIPVSGDVLVLTNFQGKRETWAREIFTKTYQYRLWSENGGNIDEIIHPIHGQNHDFFENHAKDLEASLGEARNRGNAIAELLRSTVRSNVPDGVFSPIRNQVGEIFSNQNLEPIRSEFIRVARLDSRTVRADDPNLPMRMKDVVLNYTLSWMERPFQTYLSNENLRALFIFLRTLLGEIVFSENVLSVHKKYSYNSGRTSMITDCVRLKRFDEGYYSNHKHTIRFLLAFIRTSVAVLKKEIITSVPVDCGLRIVDKTGRDSTAFRGTDLLRLYENGRIVSEISMKKFLGDLHAFGKDYQNQNRFGDEREEIVAK